jgi:phosphoribosyl 1,2-cyclic phosphodiesterase
LQLSCGDGHRRLGVLTDAGSLTPTLLARLAACDGLLLECNHDEALLRASSYPASLKRRILGSHGHLSNESAAEVLTHCLHAGLQVVAAAHLSARNNRPELAVTALAAVVDGSRPSDCGLPILVADQALGLDWQTLG